MLIKMRSVITFLFLVLIVASVQAQNNGIGVRLGDPMGVTYKKYLPHSKALEFILGSASPGWNQNYYQNSFDANNKYDNYTYRSHQVQSTLYLQGRYLLDYPIHIDGMEGKLNWYWGIGALLKIAEVKYQYRMPDQNNASDVRTDVDFGPEGIIGMEYTFEDVPLTIFGEVSLLLEIADRPGALRPFAGTGIRFNF